MTEDPAERSEKYLRKTSETLRGLKTRELPAAVSQKLVNHVLELAQGYAKDAKHYAENGRPVTSLTCVAYAEGLLDALKFLELADF